MNERTTTLSETATRGKAYYEQHLRAIVEPEHIGEFLVLDVDTGDYEIDVDELAAFDRLIARQPNGSRYLMRIGYRAAHQIGGSMRSIKAT